jgi:hypothetical protein
MKWGQLFNFNKIIINIPSSQKGTKEESKRREEKRRGGREGEERDRAGGGGGGTRRRRAGDNCSIGRRLTIVILYTCIL